ncbi:hypothetical protein AKO1_012214 [Acrasis kona]|uniref:Uncharacterized protein n=1 Tax=Acrasis kona TaxID=1008807 RepID=A0AAW2ZP37_9EUKA
MIFYNSVVVAQKKIADVQLNSDQDQTVCFRGTTQKIPREWFQKWCTKRQGNIIMSGLCDMLEINLAQYYMPKAKGVPEDKKRLSKRDVDDLLVILQHNNLYNGMDKKTLTTALGKKLSSMRSKEKDDVKDEDEDKEIKEND